MAISKAWRTVRRAVRAQSARRRGAAPVMPDPGLSVPARRVNRLVAVVVLFGAFGTVALAMALTPAAQTSASKAGALKAGALQASASQAPVKISRIEVPPAPVETVRAETTVVAVRPEPAPKGDRLARSYRAPPPTRAARSDDPEPLRGPQSLGGTGDEDSRTHRIVMIPQEPVADREAADSAERKLEEDDVERDLGFGLSDPPAPGARVDEARADAADEAVEASAEAAAEVSDEDIDEAVENAVEQAVPEPAPKPAPATRTAAVRTDVNMRARPSNGGAVVQVVPGKSTVEVIGCNYWCEVIYDGKRGYIYKGFVRGS
jgi:hypothetical protein